MIDFSKLDDTLKIAEQRNKKIPFWWRDDDATHPSAALDKLISICIRHHIPLALAIIPMSVQPQLMHVLDMDDAISVLVHGYSHTNHAPATAKQAEFGAHRPTETMLAEAKEALDILHAVVPPNRLAPIFVPPWNRISTDLRPLLTCSGYRGVSTFGERRNHLSPAGLSQINTHIDPINWRDTRSLHEPAILIDSLSRLVLRHIQGETDEPIGLLTHHLVHDEAIWSFCEALIARLATSPAIAFSDIRSLF